MHLSSAGKKPPIWLSPMPSTSGERALTVARLWPEMAAPVVGASMTVKTFSGAKAPAPRGIPLST